MVMKTRDISMFLVEKQIPVITLWKLNDKCRTEFRYLLTDWVSDIFHIIDTLAHR